MLYFNSLCNELVIALLKEENHFWGETDKIDKLKLNES
jgi:hypothetical protein